MWPIFFSMNRVIFHNPYQQGSYKIIPVRQNHVSPGRWFSSCTSGEGQPCHLVYCFFFPCGWFLRAAFSGEPPGPKKTPNFFGKTMGISKAHPKSCKPWVFNGFFPWKVNKKYVVLSVNKVTPTEVLANMLQNSGSCWIMINPSLKNGETRKPT